MSTINRAINLRGVIDCPPGAVAYLEDLIRECRFARSTCGAPPGHVGATVDFIKSILKHRRYCYLSKGRMRAYDAIMDEAIAAAVSRGHPVRFYYDIGGGYHAGIDPENRTLCFEVGLSELCILRQICVFSEAVREVYAPGTRFFLVIDNLCAHLVNDIPISKTEAYCAKLRTLIDQLGLGDLVELIVESEHFEVEQYRRAEQALPGTQAVIPPSETTIENISRFLGRDCEPAEAAQRLEAYERITAVADIQTGTLVDGLRMTQRASASTPPFRPFPGGDVRTQAGELVLAIDERERVTPRLLTSRNIGQYQLGAIDLPDVIPAVVESIRVAFPRTAR